MSDLSHDLRLFIVNRGSETRLEVGGELDLATIDALRDHLDVLIEAGTGAVFVDMSLVTFCDSTSLCALVAARQRLDEAHRSLTIVNPSPRVERLIRLAGLGDLLVTDLGQTG